MKNFSKPSKILLQYIFWVPHIMMEICIMHKNKLPFQIWRLSFPRSFLPNLSLSPPKLSNVVLEFCIIVWSLKLAYYLLWKYVI